MKYWKIHGDKACIFGKNERDGGKEERRCVKEVWAKWKWAKYKENKTRLERGKVSSHGHRKYGLVTQARLTDVPPSPPHDSWQHDGQVQGERESGEWCEKGGRVRKQKMSLLPNQLASLGPLTLYLALILFLSLSVFWSILKDHKNTQVPRSPVSEFSS